MQRGAPVDPCGAPEGEPPRPWQTPERPGRLGRRRPTGRSGRGVQERHGRGGGSVRGGGRGAVDGAPAPAVLRLRGCPDSSPQLSFPAHTCCCRFNAHCFSSSPGKAEPIQPRPGPREFVTKLAGPELARGSRLARSPPRAGTSWRWEGTVSLRPTPSPSASRPASSPPGRTSPPARGLRSRRRPGPCHHRLPLCLPGLRDCRAQGPLEGQ